jgi:hypothetical protein
MLLTALVPNWKVPSSTSFIIFLIFEIALKNVQKLSTRTLLTVNCR